MIETRTLRGVWSATITPFDASFTPDAAKAIPYYRELLDRGCNGLNVLGTSGEAMSLSVEQRVRFMEALANELPVARVMTGTGASSLADAVALTRASFDLGFAAALLMPPFFYREVTDDGVLRFFDALLTRTHSPGKSVVLYNFPKMSGVTFTAPLVDRLVAAFPGAIAAMKDSSNDRALQGQVLERHPGFAVLPSSEEFLADVTDHGTAGCISGSVCLWPELAKKVFENGTEGERAELARLRHSLPAASIIPAVREKVAIARGDDEWRRSVPPL